MEHANARSASPAPSDLASETPAEKPKLQNTDAAAEGRAFGERVACSVQVEWTQMIVEARNGADQRVPRQKNQPPADEVDDERANHRSQAAFATVVNVGGLSRRVQRAGCSDGEDVIQKIPNAQGMNRRSSRAKSGG